MYKEFNAEIQAEFKALWTELNALYRQISEAF